MKQPWPSPETIAAIVPCYTSQGDSTRIITTDGTIYPDKALIRTVIRRLAASRATDLAILKKHASRVTRTAIMQPLPLAPGLVLCPLKLRIPRITGDASTGYVNFFAVTGISAECRPPYQAELHLRGNTKLPVIWAKPTVEKHLEACPLAQAYAPNQAATALVREANSLYTPEIAALIERFIQKIDQLIEYKLHRR